MNYETRKNSCHLYFLRLWRRSSIKQVQLNVAYLPLVAKRYKSFHKYEYLYETESLNTLNGAINGPRVSCKVQRTSMFRPKSSKIHMGKKWSLTLLMYYRSRLMFLAHATSLCTPRSARSVRSSVLMQMETQSLDPMLVLRPSTLKWRSMLE